jgi:hypothetical protein
MEAVLSAIEFKSVNLGEFVDHTIGVQIGGKNMLFQGKTIGSQFLKNEPQNEETDIRNIISIDRYALPETDGYISFDIQLGKLVNKAVRDANIALPNNLPFIFEDKIILRQSCSFLCATIASSGQTGEHKFFFFKPKLNSNKSLYYLLGLINSKLLTFYALERNIIKHGHKKQPQIRIKEVIKLPIKTNQKFDKTLEELTRITFGNLSEVFSNVIDALVFNLYFLDHMQEKEIDVLEFVEQDIAKVMRDRNFEKLSDTEKEGVIEQLHQTWSHPDNEVVKRMALFKEKSPEILKPILES